MAQRADLSECLGSISNTHMVAYDHPQLQSQWIPHPFLTSVGTWHTHGAYTYTLANAHTRK